MKQAERVAALRQSVQDPYISIEQVAALTGIGVSTIHRLIRDDEFIKPVRIGKKTIRWRQSEIDRYLERSRLTA